MRKNKFIVVLLSMIMAVCLCFVLAACNNENNPPEDKTAKITEGYYDGTYVGGGYTQDMYIRFHEEGEVFEGKKTFYFQIYSTGAGGSQAMVKPMLGTYEVQDQEITLKAYSSGDGRSDASTMIERTADKTVVLKSLDGTNEYCKTGWDTKEDKLLGIPAANADQGITATNTMGVTTQHGNYCLLKKTDAKTDRGVVLATYYANVGEVRNASITIFHNGTYEDNKVTGTEAINGTYTKNGDVYTLTAGTGAKSGTLTVTATGANLAVTGQDAVTMTTERDREISYTFTGSGDSEGVTLNYTVTLFDDGSAQMVSKVGDNVVSDLEGTWVESEDADVVMTVQFGTAVTGYVTKESNNDGKYHYEVDINGATLKTEDYEAQVEALYTLTGTITGPDQTGNPTGTTYAAELKLNNDLSFSLDLTNNGQTVSAATGVFAPVMNGAVPTAYTCTVKTSTFYTVDSTFTVSITLGSSGITALSAELPAVTQEYGGNTITILNAATLQWSAVTTVYTFTGSLYSGAVTAELTLLSDGSCAYKLNGNEAGTGTWITEDFAGQTFPASITITVLGASEAATVTVTKDWTNMKLTIAMPAVNNLAVTVEYALPTAA